MDGEPELDEIWSNLDSETRESVVALVLEIAYRFVVNRQAPTAGNTGANEDEVEETQAL